MVVAVVPGAAVPLAEVLFPINLVPRNKAPLPYRCSWFFHLANEWTMNLFLFSPAYAVRLAIVRLARGFPLACAVAFHPLPLTEGRGEGCRRRSALACRGHLRQREDISIRIFEPSHPCAAWRSPDPEFVLPHSRIPLKADFFVVQSFHGLLDVRDLPAERGVLRRRNLLYLLHPERGSVGVEDNGKRRVFDQRKAQGVAIEFFATAALAVATKATSFAALKICPLPDNLSLRG